MSSRDSPSSTPISVKHMPTKEAEKIKQNRGPLGSILLRKKEGLEPICSGGIVTMKSKILPSCEYCLLTSDCFAAGDIKMAEYYVQFWDTSMSSVETVRLSKIAQCLYRLTSGLVLIPVQPQPLTFKSNSIFNKRRTFHTAYYNIEGNNNASLHCYVMGSHENIKKVKSLAGQTFRLVARTKGDDGEHMIRDGKGQLQYDYELQADAGGTVYISDKNFGTYLRPHGGVILMGERQNPTCVGVLNFSREGLICPVFIAQETLTGMFI